MARDRKRGAVTGAAFGTGLAIGDTPRSLRVGNAARKAGIMTRTQQGKALALGYGIAAGAGAGVGAAVGKKPVQKNDTTSAFGIDHGEFSKSFKTAWEDVKNEKHATHGRVATGAAFPGWHGAAAGKKGKKLRAAGNELGGAIVGSVVPGPGTLAGGAAGTAAAARKGYYKKQKAGAL